MALIDMAVEGNNDYPVASDNPYGYGLCINLTEEQVEALGLKANPPAAGSSVGIRAIATVMTVTNEFDEDGDGDVDVRMSLQITAMEVNSESKNNSAADTLYGAE